MSALPLGADIDVGVRNVAGISIGPCWRRPKCTAAPTTQWVYSRVSRASLQKTGVFLDSAGDFWEFSTQKVRTSVSRDYWRREKPAFGGPFSSKEENSLKRGLPGWGGRIRTSAWGNQNPLPYHLATPQQTVRKAAGLASRGFPLAPPVYRGR